MSNDNSKILHEQVQHAFATQKPLLIRGGGSKHFYGHPIDGGILDTRSHCGILNYQPTELTLTARAGTPLSEIEQVLSANGQMLSCEAPHFSDNATFGGMIAAGLSGPRRPYAGGIADLLLGCTILNGEGKLLRFGGQVMKNVAGYDISRLMVGALGCLGVILEATIKVVPTTKAHVSFRFQIEANKTATFINELIQLAFPVSASAFDPAFHNIDKKCLLVRFSAGEKEINHLQHLLTKEFSNLNFSRNEMDDYWLNLREQKNTFFNTESNIWRISLAPNTSALDLPGETLIEWSGALRWLKTDASINKVFSYVAEKNGNATLFKTNNSSQTIFQPLPNSILEWHKKLKLAFDPAGILNPGRMYKGL